MMEETDDGKSAVDRLRNKSRSSFDSMQLMMGGSQRTASNNSAMVQSSGIRTPKRDSLYDQQRSFSTREKSPNQVNDIPKFQEEIRS